MLKRILQTALLLAFSSVTFAQPALVAHTYSNTGLTPTSPINTTGANLYLACLSYNRPPTDSATSPANTWTLLATSTSGGGNGQGNFVYLYGVLNPHTGSSITFSGSSYGSAMTVAAFSNIAAFDQSAQNNGLVTPTITPTKANELLFSCLSADYSTTPSVTATPSTFLDAALDTDTTGMADAYQVQSGGPTGAATTFTSNQNNGGGGPGSFQAAFYSTTTPPTILFTTKTLPVAFAGQTYDTDLSFQFQTNPVTCTKTSGTLPSGFSLTNSGGNTGCHIHGNGTVIPGGTTVGLTFSATDAASNSANSISPGSITGQTTSGNTTVFTAANGLLNGAAVPIYGYSAGAFSGHPVLCEASIPGSGTPTYFSVALSTCFPQLTIANGSDSDTASFGGLALTVLAPPPPPVTATPSGLSPLSPLPSVGACPPVQDNVHTCPNLNGFVPFQGTGSLWTTNIASASADPNDSAIRAQAWWNRYLHADGAFPGAGYPYEVVDSSAGQQLFPILIPSAGIGQSDTVIAPIPLSVPIEGDLSPETNCGYYSFGSSEYNGNTYSDSHTHTLDRATGILTSTYYTQLCNGGQQIYAGQETVWNTKVKAEQQRPSGWSSEDASGSSMFVGIEKYNDVAACVAAGSPYTTVPQYAIRFTDSCNNNNDAGGTQTNVASHPGFGSCGTSMDSIGLRVRLASSYSVTSYSPGTQCVLNQIKQFGMIDGDNGGMGFVQFDTDAGWAGITDLITALQSINMSTNLQVVASNPALPGYAAGPADESTIVRVQTTATGTSASPIITVGNGSSVVNGDFVQGTNITYPGTKVSSGGGTNTITLSQNPTGTLSGNYNFLIPPICYPNFDPSNGCYSPLSGYNPPTINSFSANHSTVASGSPVTFTYSATGDTYDYIDNAGVVAAGSGTATVYPTATTTYHLFSVNTYAINGPTVSSGVTVTVTSGGSGGNVMMGGTASGGTISH